MDWSRLYYLSMYYLYNRHTRTVVLIVTYYYYYYYHAVDDAR